MPEIYSKNKVTKACVWISTPTNKRQQLELFSTRGSPGSQQLTNSWVQLL